MTMLDGLTQFRRLIGPLQRSVRMMISRGVLTLVDDTQPTQEVQLNLYAGENLSGVERFQQYGFTSVPFPGAEAIFAAVAGNRTQGVVLVAGDKRYRLVGLQSGEVALFDDQGQTIIIHRDGIAMTSRFGITMTTPTFTLNGNFQLNGSGSSTGDFVANGISADSHTHNEVQTGQGNTGKPQP